MVKLNLPGFHRLRPKTPLIGVDVGSSSVKIARVRFDGPCWKVTSAGIVPARGTDPAGETPERIREFLRENNIPRPWRAATALSGQETEIRTLDVPAGDASTLPQRVLSAAERVLPFGTQDTILDFFSLGRSFDSGEKTERVLLAAAGRRSVDRRLEFLERAGMVPEVIELIPWALVRAITFLGACPEEAPFGILDFGHTASTIMIFDKEDLFLSRSVRSGAKTLTEKVRKELDMDWDRAEQLKGDRGLSLAARACRAGGCDEGSTMVAEILDDLFLPTLAHLADEIEKSIAFYASESQGGMLDRLILTGGGARLKNLDLFLGERLGLPVRTAGPAFEDPAARPEDPAPDWPVMATALGLSARDAGMPDRRLNPA